MSALFGSATNSQMQARTAGTTTRTPTNEKRALKLLIFDLDGTLYRTETSFDPAVAQVLHAFSARVPPEAKLHSFIGEPFDAFLEWLDHLRLPVPRETLRDRIAEAELRFVEECGKLYPGVKETLARLHTQGYWLALCTNAGELYAKTVLRACGIEGLFREIRCRRTSAETKEKMVAWLTSRIPHSRAYIIGDRYHDLVAGRKAGCTVIGAAYGYAKPGELGGADHIIASFVDLPALV